MKRAASALLFAVLLLVGVATKAEAGAYRYCINIGLSSSGSPIKICLPFTYAE